MKYDNEMVSCKCHLSWFVCSKSIQNFLFSLHCVVRTDTSRWCEVIRQKRESASEKVLIKACSPEETKEGLEKWLNLTADRQPATFQLLFEAVGHAAMSEEDRTTSPEKWTNLWLMMSTNQLLPCLYTENKQ